METKIYCLSHRDFIPPDDDIYVPLSVLNDEGDNISDKNCYYSELTGCYWAWKNSHADIIGVCHYRRYLLNDRGRLLNSREIEAALNQYDLITPKVLTLDFPYEYGFSKNHKPYYLQELRGLLKEKYPRELAVYDNLVRDVHTLFGNMLISGAELFKDYHSWLFDILFNLEKRIVINEKDSYHRRIFGFISEFLLYLYITMNNLKFKQTMVGMIGEKTEVISIKRRIWELFKIRDYIGAKEYFLNEYKKRPDILMEASDIGGELHILMEAMAIIDHEADNGIPPFADSIEEYQELIDYIRRLNNSIGEFKELEGFSREAVYVARTLWEAKRGADNKREI